MSIIQVFAMQYGWTNMADYKDPSATLMYKKSTLSISVTNTDYPTFISLKSCVNPYLTGKSCESSTVGP